MAANARFLPSHPTQSSVARINGAQKLPLYSSGHFVGSVKHEVNCRMVAITASNGSCGHVWRYESPTAADDEALGGRQRRELPYGLHAALLPRHVALTLDGTNRWARVKGVSKAEAYEACGKAWTEVIRLSAEWGISAFTSFFFSTENWGRPQGEVQVILQAYTTLMHSVCDEFVKHNVQARTIGDITRLPASLQDALQSLEHKTSQMDGLKLTICMSYGGRYDIVQACQRIVAKARSDPKILLTDINEDFLNKEMLTGWLPPHIQSPDLCIRTGGSKRLSNFLLWQCSYSELMFLDCLMPDFDEITYGNALLAYTKRTRTFGGR